VQSIGGAVKHDSGTLTDAGQERSRKATTPVLCGCETALCGFIEPFASLVARLACILNPDPRGMRACVPAREKAFDEATATEEAQAPVHHP